MSALQSWPDVDVDEYGQMTCPMPRCDEQIHLIRSYCIVLVAEQDTDHEASDAISDDWRVECINGHVLYTSVDQIREMNLDDPELCLDETGDYTPEFDLLRLHTRINTLGGPRL